MHRCDWRPPRRSASPQAPDATRVTLFPDAVGRSRHIATGCAEAASPPIWTATAAISDVPRAVECHAFSECLTPLVFRGLCSAWPALQRWNADTLARTLPSVRVSRSQSGHFPRDAGVPCPTESVPTKRFLRELHHGKPHVYVHGEVLPEALAADCPLPGVLAGESIARRSLWISGSGACSPLHYDLPNVLLCQVCGRKRVILYSPRYHDLLKPLGTTFPALTAQARIARTPRTELSAIEGMQVELQPGDALFMPSGWWHEVQSESDDGASGLCISVGINFPDIADSIASFGRYLDSVREYPILTKGQVLSMYCGEEKARAMPGFDEPVFAS